MVTFSLPGDDDVVEAANGTANPRAPLPFAKRTYTASPLASGSFKRNGTPQTAPSRRFALSTREDDARGSLSNSSIATARNIFRASTFSDSPPSTAFSPSLPPSAMKKVFAPGATPEPTRTFRQSTAQATPRGMASKVTEKELFPMRISSPPPELSGEVLTQKVPKEWNSKGSIYADQFLAHLCPPGLDDEQRRQFFCILDLRRLKYAANEIFSRKDWKLKVINFAKEFEKSRSIILLRYGLYEFQNVKPSKEVLKRWRREHGLPEPEEEESFASPTKQVSTKKRKADEDLPKVSAATSNSAPEGKRRAVEEEEPVATPAPSKNKRKASVGEEQPSKMQKAAPSSAKSLFEKIANKPAFSIQDSQAPAVARANPINAKTSSSSNLARSVLTSSKSLGGQGSTPAGSNIFGYLSDASSTKNSGVEADAESESETGSEEASPGEGHSDEPSVAASGAGEAASQVGSGLFATKPGSLSSGSGPGLSSNPGTRESTPGRSLFARVTKDSEGQPLRAEEADDSNEMVAAPRDQTWNPSTTPIKFASSTPGAQKHGLFGQAGAAPASSVFAPKSTTTSINFGAAAQDASSAKASSAGASTEGGGKDSCESDKENKSQPSRKSPFAVQPSLGSSLFQPKPTSTEPAQESEAAKINNVFGAAAKTDSKLETAPTATNFFGTLTRASGAAADPARPSLFGAKPAQAEKTAESEAPKTGSLFGGMSTPSTLGNPAAASSVFGANKPVSSPASGPGSGASTPSTSLFGASSAQPIGTAAVKSSNAGPTTEPQPQAQPQFSFGSASSIQPGGFAAAKTNDAGPTTAHQSQSKFTFGSASNSEETKTGSEAEAEAAPPKPLFGGATRFPPLSAAGNSLFGGSPMKQDGPSPAKKAFDGGSGSGTSGPAFGFGNPQDANSGASGTSIFGGTSAPPAATPASGIFGAGTPSNAGPGGFNFSFGGAAAPGSAFNNPFAQTPNPAAGEPSGGSFSFGGNSSGPASSSASFQFGSGTGANAATSGGSVFGTAQPAANAPSAFGGASAPGGGPVFNFSGPPSQPAGAFGSSQAVPALGGLQPPAGGSSTTGTNSLNFGGGSSLATTPAAGTPEPSNHGEGAPGREQEEGEKHEQINLTDEVDADEDVEHEVRAKALKYVAPTESDGSGKTKSPWSTQGVGPIRLLKHKETGMVRLVLRAEPRGHVVLNRAVLPNMSYKADGKYVKITTSNETGDGLETWMVQVKTGELARELAEVLEKNKGSNRQ